MDIIEKFRIFMKDNSIPWSAKTTAHHTEFTWLCGICDNFFYIDGEGNWVGSTNGVANTKDEAITDFAKFISGKAIHSRGGQTYHVPKWN